MGQMLGNAEFAQPYIPKTIPAKHENTPQAPPHIINLTNQAHLPANPFSLVHWVPGTQMVAIRPKTWCQALDFGAIYGARHSVSAEFWCQAPDNGSKCGNAIIRSANQRIVKLGKFGSDLLAFLIQLDRQRCVYSGSAKLTHIGSIAFKTGSVLKAIEPFLGLNTTPLQTHAPPFNTTIVEQMAGNSFRESGEPASIRKQFM